MLQYQDIERLTIVQALGTLDDRNLHLYNLLLSSKEFNIRKIINQHKTKYSNYKI